MPTSISSKNLGSQAAPQTRSKVGHISESATHRWEIASRSGRSLLDGHKLYLEGQDLAWPRVYLTTDLAITVIAAGVVLVTHSTRLTPLWFDICVATVYEAYTLFCLSCPARSGQSIDHNNSQRMYEFGWRTLLFSRFLWTYIVIKCVVALVYGAIYLNMTIALIVFLDRLIQKQCSDALGAHLERTLGRALGSSRVADLSTILTEPKTASLMLQVYHRIRETLQSSQPDNRFEYTRVGTDEIRLLHLPRRPPFGRLSARLSIVKLHEAPPYEAISYAWGDSTQRRSLLINGKHFTSTLSAWEALIAHASWWQAKTLWIDQLCINQADNHEKGQQVAMMFDIYRGAERVVAHLGDPPNASAAVMMLSKLMSKDFQDSKLDTASFVATALSFGGYPAIMKLLQHPWFSRVWIVQEVAAAKQLAVAYGGFLIEWDSMASAIRVLQRPGPHNMLLLQAGGIAQVVQSMNNILELTMIADRVRTNLAGGLQVEVEEPIADVSLPWILGRTINFKATNPRDRIYALQAMSMPSRLSCESPLLLEYDYSSSVEETYLTLARKVLSTFSDPFYLMSYAGLDKQGSLILPSWCPDWTASRTWKHGFNSRLDAQNLDHVNLYSSSKSRELAGMETAPSGPSKGAYRASGVSRPVIIQKGSTLIAHGVKIGAITNVSRTHSPGLDVGTEQHTFRHARSLCPSRTKTTESRLSEALEIAEEVYDDPTIRNDAFWRTLIGDCWGYKRPAPKKAAIAYEAWRYKQAVCSSVCARLDAGVPDVEIPHDDLNTMATMYEPWWAFEYGKCADNRAFASVAGKYIAVVPQGTEVGDVVVVPLGAKTPWVIRPLVADATCPNSRSHFVGEAYVHGIMDGECVTQDIALASVEFSTKLARETRQKTPQSEQQEEERDERADSSLMSDIRETSIQAGSLGAKGISCESVSSPNCMPTISSCKWFTPE